MKKAIILDNHLGKNPSEDEKDNEDETKFIEKVLKELNFEVHMVPFSFNVQKTINILKKINPDFVFNLVESIEEKDSLAHFSPAILELLEIPYTGCSAESMYLSTNKLTTKKILQNNGILTPKWANINEITNKNSTIKDKCIIIKHLYEHASEDIDDSSVFFAKDKSKLKKSLKRRDDPRKYFAEEFIDGREFNISLIEEENGGRVLPPAEMTFINYPKGKFKIIDYKAKWDENSFEYKNTVRKFDFGKEDKKLIESLEKISKRVWEIFGLRGYARVDFRVDKKGTPYVLEINANPCISPDGGFIAACEKEGMDHKTIISKLVKSAYKK